jgi:regulatory protein
MKIIRPSGRSGKGASSSAPEKEAERRDARAPSVTIDSATDVRKLKSKEWKPRSKKKRSASSRKRSKFSENDSQLSADRAEPDHAEPDHAEPEEEYDFDVSRLEAMPKEEVCEVAIEGKKRRRSELQAEKIGEPLSLSIDPAKKEFNELFARGLRLLAMREHSVKELTKKLFDKSEKSLKVDDADDADGSNSSNSSDRAKVSDAIHAVIDDLLEKKYLSDERFTEVYIRSRGNRGFGPIKIEAELKSKGVSNNLIQDHLDKGAALWFDNAKTQYQKKYADSPINDYSAWTKRANFMQSRGFTMEQIQVTVPQFSFD